MKISFKKRTSERVVKRLKARARIRKKVEGTTERPRLCIYKSTNNIYAQIIDDTTGTTLASTSTQALKLNSVNLETAKQVGAEIAKVAQSKNIESVVFDRSGYVYHGKVKSFADAAREAGLKF